MAGPLLDGDDDPSRLAQQLFEYADEKVDSRVRVLLLSATPYKMYMLRHQMDEDDHYADIRRTVSFLEPEETRIRAFEADLGAYRRELYRLGTGDGGEIETFETKVYTIGVGTRGKAPFIVDSLFGKRVIYEDVEIDEEMLREISARTGGSYFRAEDSEALAEIYDEIDRLETSEITTESYMEYDERYRRLVLPALGLLLLETLLLGTRFRKLP